MGSLLCFFSERESIGQEVLGMHEKQRKQERCAGSSCFCLLCLLPFLPFYLPLFPQEMVIFTFLEFNSKPKIIHMSKQIWKVGTKTTTHLKALTNPNGKCIKFKRRKIQMQIAKLGHWELCNCFFTLQRNRSKFWCR